MKKIIKLSVVSAVFLICLGRIFTCYNCVLKGVTSGLYLCANVVIPSFFPMLCLTGFLSESAVLETVAKRIDKFSAKYFNLSGYFLPIFILSIISGYPVGAATANTLFENKKITGNERNKISLISCSAGPAFIVLAVGVNMYNSYKIGVILLISNTFSTVLTALIVTRFYKVCDTPALYGSKNPIISDCIVLSVKNATSSIISISAFTVIFSAIITVLSSSENPFVFYTAVSLLEVTNASLTLVQNGFSLEFISAVIGFGGLSVIFQISAILKTERPPITKMIAVRFLNGGISYSICKTVSRFFKVTAPTVKGCNTYFKITDGNIPFSISLILLAVVFLLFLQKSQGGSYKRDS